MQTLAAETAQQDRTKKELAAFLGDVKTPFGQWGNLDGPDFTLFYCVGTGGQQGAAAIYLASVPFVREKDREGVAIEGKIGRFPVRWFQRALPDGSLQQEVYLMLSPDRFAHIVISGGGQKDLDRFIAELSQLPAFAAEPVENGGNFSSGPGLVSSKLRLSGGKETGKAAK